MAGLTKAELAGKSAYTNSTTPPPEKEWRELTQGERDLWIAQAEAGAPSDVPPDGAAVDGPADSRETELANLKDVIRRGSAENAELQERIAELLRGSEALQRQNEELVARLDSRPLELLPGGFFSPDSPPARTPEQGDLTPDYALWLAKTNPAAARAQYQGREHRLPDAVQDILKGGADV